MVKYGVRKVVDGRAYDIHQFFNLLSGVRAGLRELTRSGHPLFGNRHFLSSGRLSSLLGVDHEYLRSCESRKHVSCVQLNKGVLCGMSSVRGLLRSGCRRTLVWSSIRCSEVPTKAVGRQFQLTFRCSSVSIEKAMLPFYLLFVDQSVSPSVF